MERLRRGRVQRRREAQAARIASLIVAVLSLFLLVTCVHMFSHML